jgi:hypothetical protein
MEEVCGVWYCATGPQAGTLPASAERPPGTASSEGIRPLVTESREVGNRWRCERRWCRAGSPGPRSLSCISATPSPDIGRMRPLTMLRLLRANPAGLTGRAPRSAAEAGEWMVRGHRVIGSPGYPLDEVWLRRIGEIMYVRGGFDRAARARQGAAILAKGTGDLH